MRLSCVLGSLFVLVAGGCRHHPTDPVSEVDPTAGRDRITIFYSSNLWGELLDCG